MFTILQAVVCLLGCTLGVSTGSEIPVCGSQITECAPGVTSLVTVAHSGRLSVSTLPNQTSQNAIRQEYSGATGTSLRNSDSAFTCEKQNSATFCQIPGRYALNTFNWSVLAGNSLQILFCTWLM